MLYNQPLDQKTNLNAPYIDGDPSAGIQGSIVPAASLEYDQREIVAVIQYAANLGLIDFNNVVCANPTNSDLTQLLKAIFGMTNARYLTAPKTYYVDTHTGNDAFNGLTPTTAFKTLQRAANQAAVYNLNGFSVTINVADGTYGKVALGPVNGTGTIAFVGNTGIPGNCIIHANTGPAVYCNGGVYTMNGFRYESDAGLPSGIGTILQPGAGIWSVPGGNVVLYGANEFGACVDGHLFAQNGSLAYSGTIRIAGNTANHVISLANSWMYTFGSPAFPTLIIPASVNIGCYANVGAGGVNTIRYASMTGNANVVGQKFNASSNGILDTGGQSQSWLPGTTAGTISTGGQYT
jgi:hypothetical protein